MWKKCELLCCLLLLLRAASSLELALLATLLLFFGAVCNGGRVAAFSLQTEKARKVVIMQCLLPKPTQASISSRFCQPEQFNPKDSWMLRSTFSTGTVYGPNKLPLTHRGPCKLQVTDNHTLPFCAQFPLKIN